MMIKRYKSIYQDPDSYFDTVRWCLEYVTEYTKNGGDFDPFKILTGTDNNKSKLNTETLYFLDQLENLVLEYRKTRQKLL